MSELDLNVLKTDVNRARAYVLAHGGSRDYARLDGILAGARPPKDVVKALEELQNPDGGFPLFQQSGNPSSIDTTCYVLVQLKDMPPLAGSPMASRAVSFLRRTQRPDGSWAEAPEVQPIAPPWTKGEGLAAVSYLTAIAAYTAFSLDPDHLDPIRRSAEWLTRADLSRVYPQTDALACALFYKLEHLDLASRHFAQISPQSDPLLLAWFLSCALESRMGGGFTIPIVQMLARLAGQQQADGSWAGEAGFATEATLQALRVFRGYGLIESEGEANHV